MAFPNGLIVTWLTGIAMGKFTGRATVSSTEVSPKVGGMLTDEKSFQLEALKAIRESAAFRWDKRRSYEWQLSISIWTAAAAFSGIMLNKDFPVDNSHLVAWVVGVCAALIGALHSMYVKKMVDQTMADASIQRWVEQKIYCMAFGQEITGPDDIKPEREFYPRMTRYRLIQVAITIILMVGCVMSVLAPRRQSIDYPASAPAKSTIK